MTVLKKIIIFIGVMLNLVVCGNFVGRADTVYTADPSNIQWYINNCNDSEQNRVTIYMQPGNYSPISCMSHYRERYISLIGISDVTVSSYSGIYDDPAAFLRINGEVSNITFVANKPAQGLPVNDKGGYAVHADYGSQHTVFNNCTFISYQAAALGMGITPDSTIVLNNCTLKNLSSPDSTSFWQLGALYAHTAKNDLVGIDNAQLKLVNCVTEAPKGAYSDVFTQDLDGLHLKYDRI